MRTLLTLAALLTLSATADAGPIRDRIRARFSGGSCPSCTSCAGCQSADPSYPSPAPVPVDPGLDVSPDPRGASAAPVGALVTTTGRTLLPNGDGTYRYADETVRYAAPVSPAYYLPSAPLQGCPNGRCPVR